MATMIATTARRGRRKAKVNGVRSGELTSPHVYGRKKTVWGETFRFGHDLRTAEARALRLLALKSEQEAAGATGWTAETKARAWRIAKGEEGEAAPQQSSDGSSPHVDSGTLRTLGYDIAPSEQNDAPEATPAATGKPSLYAAFDAYLEQLQTSDHSMAGRVKAQRKALPDMPLDRLGERELRQLVRYWKSKPIATTTIWVQANGRKVPKVVDTDRRLSALSVKKGIQAARQFFAWLASADSGYDWRAPFNVGDIFRLTNADFSALKSDAERMAENKLRNDKDAMHFRYEELEALWHATGISKLRKAYFLLALNLSASTSEIANLKLGDCFLEGDHAARPFAAFVRNKTKRHDCYGKWFLWAETAEALREAIRQRKAEGRGKETDPVFVTEDGNPLVTPSPGGHRNDSVKLVWKGWAKRAKIERLSWKNLRKTSSQLVRKAATSLGMSGDYMAELHTAHAAPAMSRAYNRRDDSEYELLGKALAEVRASLKFLDRPKVVVVSSVEDKGSKRAK